MNKVYVLTQVEDNGEILSTNVFRTRLDAVYYGMEQIFGEDWELHDMDWERRPDLLDVMDAFYEDHAYKDSDGSYWYLTRNEVK